MWALRGEASCAVPSNLNASVSSCSLRGSLGGSSETQRTVCLLSGLPAHYEASPLLPCEAPTVSFYGAVLSLAFSSTRVCETCLRISNSIKTARRHRHKQCTVEQIHRLFLIALVMLKMWVCVCVKLRRFVARGYFRNYAWR